MIIITLPITPTHSTIIHRTIPTLLNAVHILLSTLHPHSQRMQVSIALLTLHFDKLITRHQPLLRIFIKPNLLHLPARNIHIMLMITAFQTQLNAIQQIACIAVPKIHSIHHIGSVDTVIIIGQHHLLQRLQFFVLARTTFMDRKYRPSLTNKSDSTANLRKHHIMSACSHRVHIAVAACCTYIARARFVELGRCKIRIIRRPAIEGSVFTAAAIAGFIVIETVVTFLVDIVRIPLGQWSEVHYFHGNGIAPFRNGRVIKYL
mmetsp:Transcript_60710/g.96435  ORF Transcript_60710/g.96435 Transcript_60710/m.96435 type:complete len:262 (-) Transcript_60710:613-1398(-)